jgi:hypothetical protein
MSLMLVAQNAPSARPITSCMRKARKNAAFRKTQSRSRFSSLQRSRSNFLELSVRRKDPRKTNCFVPDDDHDRISALRMRESCSAVDSMGLNFQK